MANILIFLLSIFLLSSCGSGSSSKLPTSDSPRVALTTLEVTLSTDNNPGGIGDPGELRYALNIMNQQLETIPDDYAITFAFPMTIQLNGILPIINNSSNPVNITIGNPGSIPTVTIDGNGGAYSGFFIANGNVTIQNMIFQNLTARGGNGGDGISGGGGGLGAGGALYVPQTFLNGSNPSVTLMNVSINSCSAEGGNGGSYLGGSSTGNEGGGGGGGFSGNGGSIVTTGSTGGGGGGGFGGNGGNVTLSTDFGGGGGGGGGGLGSRATLGTPTNLGNGGSDQDIGLEGSGYDLLITAGSGGGGNAGGTHAGGGGGGGSLISTGGGGGGSGGADGSQPVGSIPPDSSVPSGGYGGDGGGGGGGGVVITSPSSNGVDGQPGRGGYGGGGGGGAGVGAYDIDYTVRGGVGGIGGGGGGGGVNQSGTTPAGGGDSSGGGGGGGGGPSNGAGAQGGGTDTGNLGGGAGGAGAETYGAGFGGGGGGGGSGLGGAIFVDSNLNLTVQAIPGIPTTFNTSSNTTQAGTPGTGGSGGGSDGTPGSAVGNSIFLRTGSSLTFMAQDTGDLLTLGDQVAFTDDTIFGLGGTSIFVRGNGTVIYNGTTDYQGSVTINNANFKVNGQISAAPISVCRNSSFSPQRGTLSGHGIVNGDVLANSGTISPDAGETLTLGSLILNSAASGSLGSLVHIDINSGVNSLVAVNGPATLAGILEINVDASTPPGHYTLLTSSGITGTFDSVSFTGATPLYSISYEPTNLPTYVDFIFNGFPSTPSPPTNVAATVEGQTITLTWTNPSDPDFDSVTIRMSTTNYPSSVTDGDLLAENVTTESYSSSNFTPGTTYYFSLFTKDTEGNFSTPATVSATVGEDNAGDLTGACSLNRNATSSSPFLFLMFSLAGLIFLRMKRAQI